jgi:hypothetical protein
MTKEDLENSIAMQIQFLTISGETKEKTIERISRKAESYAKARAVKFEEFLRPCDFDTDGTTYNIENNPHQIKRGAYTIDQLWNFFNALTQ